MRFMILMIPGDQKLEAGILPDQTDIAPMMKFNEALAKAGVLLALDGGCREYRARNLMASNG
jgi:hypothetical protein